MDAFELYVRSWRYCCRIVRASNGLGRLALAKSRPLREQFRGHSIGTPVLKSLWPFRIAYLCSFSEATACNLAHGSEFHSLCRNSQVALFLLRLWYGCLMGVEPLPNIRDGILVERLVKIMRYVSDMRGREYVVEGPEGVRRRQRLNVEYVDRRAGDLLVLQHADQSLLFDDRPARRIDQPGRWLHFLHLRGSYQAARTAAQRQMDRQDVGPLEQLVLGNQNRARGFGGLWRHVLAPGNQIHSKSDPNPRNL